jgi:hypothetical protein
MRQTYSPSLLSCKGYLNSYLLEDIQIVNGLQTTESVFRHFNNGKDDKNERSILIKIIVSTDENVRDSIIRATNNQTDVELSSLHATDKIQRDIEDILQKSGLYYERRKNFYTNLGHPLSEIVTPLYLASGYVNLIHKNPSRAASLRSKFMRSDESYGSVFSLNVPIEIWPRIAYILKNTDAVLESMRPRRSKATEGLLKKWRQLTSLIATSRAMGTYLFSAGDLARFNIENISEQMIRESWLFVSQRAEEFDHFNPWSVNRFVVAVCKEGSEKWGIEGYRRVGPQNQKPKKDKAKSNEQVRKDKKPKSMDVTMEFALEVDKLLPPQPWKPGIENEVIKSLGCTRAEYFGATKLLINEGIRHYQKNGVVYDSEGNVVCFDAERVDEEKMRLKQPI